MANQTEWGLWHWNCDESIHNKSNSFLIRRVEHSKSTPSAQQEFAIRTKVVKAKKTKQTNKTDLFDAGLPFWATITLWFYRSKGYIGSGTSRLVFFSSFLKKKLKQCINNITVHYTDTFFFFFRPAQKQRGDVTSRGVSGHLMRLFIDRSTALEMVRGSPPSAN